MNRSNGRVNILILLRPQEEDVTIETIESVLMNPYDDFTLSVLMNGGNSLRLKRLFQGNERIHYYESPRSLGVAGGRNALLQKKESRSADIIMILDNDVVCPIDYIQSITSFLLKQEDSGIVGPVIADVRYLNYKVVKHYGDYGVFGNRVFQIKSSEIRKYILGDFYPFRVYHMGTHPDSFYAYFSIMPKINSIISNVVSLVGINIRLDPSLKYNTRYHIFLQQGKDKIQVTNVGGGAQTFRRSLIDQIGTYDNRFNPFGYEDVEFSIRSMGAGFKNYIDLNTWIYHGTDNRQKTRDTAWETENRFRGLTICSALVFKDRARCKRIMIKLILFESVFELMRFSKNGIKYLRARISGFQNALRSINP